MPITDDPILGTVLFAISLMASEHNPHRNTIYVNTTYMGKKGRYESSIDMFPPICFHLNRRENGN
jgi:hypothetical protein